jgi:hypothetical protein
MLSPWLGAGVLSLHLRWHAHDGAHERVPFDIVLHGHDHYDGTPPHDHFLLTSGVAPRSDRTSLRPTLAVSAVHATVVLSLAGRPSVSPTGSTHDPPPAAARPVLKI